MRFIIILLIALFSPFLITTAAAQCNEFFQFKEGQIREYTMYNKKDKVMGKEVQKVIQFNETADGFTMQLETTNLDKKGKESSTAILDGACKDGVFTFDIRDLMNGDMAQSFEGMEVTVEGTPLQMPASLSVGQELPSGDLNISGGPGGASLVNMTMNISNRRVTDKTSITTEAGNFDCYVVEQDMEMKFMFTRNYHSKDYITAKHGAVRSETYDKNGNLVTRRDLTAVR